MSQHYPRPEEVLTGSFKAPSKYSLRKLKEIIQRDGLIVPILVNEKTFTDAGEPYKAFEVADQYQAERVTACEELGFETVLVETEWDEEDL